MENWGSGAKRIIDACKVNGLHEPRWEEDGSFVVLTFFRPFKNVGGTLIASDRAVMYGDFTHHDGLKNPPSTHQVPTKYQPSTKFIEKVVCVMSDVFMSRSEIMEALGMVDRTSFRINYLLPTIAEEAVIALYPDKPTHNKQQYKLTEKAMEWKRSVENSG